MVNWLLFVKAVALISLPSLLLLYSISIRSNSGEGSQPTVATLSHSQPSTPPPPPPSEGVRSILVTGSAGFIGYHVSRALAEQWGATVIGLDNFNDYYDVQLKLDRTNELIKVGVLPYRGDVCDSTLLSYLFSKYKFTDVVHLAAQAGVRHSLEKPLNFIQANIQCFLTLLDTLTHHKLTAPALRLVFASSSSVYGEGATLPFSTSSPPHSITNVYAASKMANEQFAEAYCTQHGLRTTGLRFFTVYGPWGRPDMAVYKFAQQISKGLPVSMFNSSRPLKRDFTFVNDTVGGVLAALNHTPTKCGEVYNVGTGQPLTLNTMLEYLEEELNTPAKINLLPLPPSDLQSTYADISETRRVLGYRPTVSLREGIHEFVRWFTWYSKRRKSLEEGNLSPSNTRLRGFVEAGEREVAAAHIAQLEHINTAYRQRMTTLRNKYAEFAKERGRKLHNMKKNGFVFHEGVDSPGGTVIRAPGYHGDMKLLRDRCLQTEQCIAFNTMAELKNKLQPQRMWTRTAEGEGLYVADMDMCDSDLHDCDRHADCVSMGPGGYSCSCDPGYVRLGRGCVEKYKEGRVNDVEESWQLSDHLEGLSWDKIVEGRPFIFFQGLDSPGGDYLVVEGGAGDPVRLEEVCRHVHHCLAFNTNGILKHSVQPPSKWARWTDHSQHGLYVRDIDYCSLGVEECPTHSRCDRNAPANYSCVCKPPLKMVDDGSNHVLCTKKEEGRDYIHIIISVDREHFPGVVGVVSSTLSHASQPERLRFHVVLSGVEESVLQSFLRCYGLGDHPQLEVTQLNPGWLEGRVKVYTDVNRVGNLASLANFGRFLFHEHFPELSRAIYLDADTIVLGNIGEFWNRLHTTDKLLLAVPRGAPSYGNVFNERVKDKFQERYGFTFQDSDPTFNAGVYGINFDLWRKKHIHKEVQYWMSEQAKQPLWDFGTQPIILLVSYLQWEELGQEWNVEGLGWKQVLREDVINSAKLLHWNGKGKPWLEDGLHNNLWSPHLPLECSGRGSCNKLKETAYVCLCRGDHTGTNCQIDRPPAL